MPRAAINPDHIAIMWQLKDGEMESGVIFSGSTKIKKRLCAGGPGSPDINLTIFEKSKIAGHESFPVVLSLIARGIVARAFDRPAQQQRDCWTFFVDRKARDVMVIKAGAKWKSGPSTMMTSPGGRKGKTSLEESPRSQAHIFSGLPPAFLREPGLRRSKAVVFFLHGPKVLSGSP